MMKVIAIVLCMSVLVASQDFMNDGLGRLMALNLLSGRSLLNFNGVFGGAPAAQQTRTSGATGAGRQMTLGVNPLGLLVFDVI